MNFKYNPKTQKYDGIYKCKLCKKQKSVTASDRKTLLNHKHRCRGCYCRLTKSKPVTFKNLITGEVISAKSITDFVRYRKLGANAKFHFTRVLNGEALHYKGWGLNKKYNINKEKITVTETKWIKQALI